MPVNPQNPEPRVTSQQPPPAPEAQQPPPKSAQEIAQDMLKARMGSVAGIDPAVLQTLMAIMLPMVGEMGRTMAIELRKPTPEEEAKLLAEKERQKNRSIQAAKAGEMEAAMIRQQQANCTHSKPNGEHTFRGQVHANGWAEIKCIRCLVKFHVRPLPEHIANGLNLGEIRGLTIEHLRAWQKNSAEIDRRIRASQEAMLGLQAGVRSMGPTVGAAGI